jgi:hypothetical protein
MLALSQSTAGRIAPLRAPTTPTEPARLSACAQASDREINPLRRSR